MNLAKKLSERASRDRKIYDFFISKKYQSQLFAAFIYATWRSRWALIQFLAAKIVLGFEYYLVYYYFSFNFLLHLSFIHICFICGKRFLDGLLQTYRQELSEFVVRSAFSEIVHRLKACQLKIFIFGLILGTGFFLLITKNIETELQLFYLLFCMSFAFNALVALYFTTISQIKRVRPSVKIRFGIKLLPLATLIVSGNSGSILYYCTALLLANYSLNLYLIYYINRQLKLLVRSVNNYAPHTRIYNLKFILSNAAYSFYQLGLLLAFYYYEHQFYLYYLIIFHLTQLSIFGVERIIFSSMFDVYDGLKKASTTEMIVFKNKSLKLFIIYFSLLTIFFVIYYNYFSGNFSVASQIGYLYIFMHIVAFAFYELAFSALKIGCLEYKYFKLLSGTFGLLFLIQICLLNYSANIQFLLMTESLVIFMLGLLINQFKNYHQSIYFNKAIQVILDDYPRQFAKLWAAFFMYFKKRKTKMYVYIVAYNNNLLKDQKIKKINKMISDSYPSCKIWEILPDFSVFIIPNLNSVEELLMEKIYQEYIGDLVYYSKLHEGADYLELQKQLTKFTQHKLSKYLFSNYEFEQKIEFEEVDLVKLCQEYQDRFKDLGIVLKLDGLIYEFNKISFNSYPKLGSKNSSRDLYIIKAPEEGFAYIKVLGEKIAIWDMRKLSLEDRQKISKLTLKISIEMSLKILLQDRKVELELPVFNKLSTLLQEIDPSIRTSRLKNLSNQNNLIYVKDNETAIIF